MKIENMEQVKQNLGKRVRFQYYEMKESVTGVIIYGETKSCTGDLVGYENFYSVLYDKFTDDCCIWCEIEACMFKYSDIVLFETIED